MPIRPDVAIVIPTFNATAHFVALTRGLEQQTCVQRDQILIVDSSSTDGSAELFRRWGARVHVIPQSQFDHGGTRRLATQLTKPAEYVIFLTQDAAPADPHALDRLLSAFEDHRVGMAYGCQLPRPHARSIERHARLKNYPPDICEVRSIEDRGRLGIKTAFCSDSFAAYRRSALDTVGGMPESAFFAEDQIVAGRMLIHGWHIAYRGDAKVTHSHNYTVLQDFKRSFDVGIFHAQNPWLLRQFGKAEGEGLRFALSELNYVWKTERTALFSAVVRTIAKYAGYRLGLLDRHFSLALKRRLSMARYYWERPNIRVDR